VAGCVGWLSGRSAPVQLSSVAAATPAVSAAAGRPAAPAVPRAPDWRAVLDGLDASRAAAFAHADPAPLAQVYAAGSPLLTADRAAVARLHATGRTARGVRHTVRTVTVSSYDGTTATLRTVDVLAAYEVMDASGRVAQRTAARLPAAFVVTVVSTAQGWRLQQVVPA
ncbi:MAG: serine/threonine protein kinase, partial [Frankiales bacterium]|nr:serine/threonine protein kinase [Frankiales bacterium]